MLGRFATGVVVVTGVGDKGPLGLTAQSFASLSLDPPLVLFCPAKSSSSWPTIKADGRFCVNILADDQDEISGAFARSGGDKFAGVAWRPSSRGLPLIEGCTAHVECDLDRVVDAGDHEVAIGSVVDLHLGRDHRPLLFYRGRYERLIDLASEGPAPGD